MKLDKELYRQAYQQYREWNEAELRERVRAAGQRDPQEGWRQFLDLWTFYRQMRLQQSEWQGRERLAALNRYYERVQKLEARRRTAGGFSATGQNAR
jgi:hypothetical protein